MDSTMRARNRPRLWLVLRHVAGWGAIPLAVALAACGDVGARKGDSGPADSGPDAGRDGGGGDDGGDEDGGCTPVGIDLPDDDFEDTDCDGVDGDAEDGIFVDPIHGDDGGDGSRAQPKAHLLGVSGAFAAAAALERRHIFVSTGTLSESATVEVPDGISVWGGYDATRSWTRSDSIERPLLDVADPTGVRFTGTIEPMTWDRVDVQSADATSEGASSYGMFMVEATDLLVVSNSIVTAGSGAVGSASQTPLAPETPEAADGRIGRGLIEAICCVRQLSDNCVAGAPGLNECAFAGGRGDRCGAAGGRATDGEGPDGGDGAPGSRAQGEPGGPGAAGGDATAPTTAFGTVAVDGYTPAQGTAGTAGAGGSGGGGGGLDYPGFCSCDAYVAFPPGHGGGAGGCGGEPATAAGGGGGSFALFLFDASPTFDRVTAASGAGGAGGAGAAGGPGGAGGAGGGQPESPVAGGNGGAGGAGGTSSGGPGGPSICLEKVGKSTPVLVTPVANDLGSAGSGGVSPNADLNGLGGVAAEERTD